MPSIESAKVLIMSTHGFEQSELTGPKDQLTAAGATVHVATPDGNAIRGWDGDDWGDRVDADLAINDVKVDDYIALVLPGGQINPDLLRVDESAVHMVREFVAANKIVAAICHAPWLLIEAGVVEGREMTSYKSIRTDLKTQARTSWIRQSPSRTASSRRATRATSMRSWRRSRKRSKKANTSATSRLSDVLSVRRPPVFWAGVMLYQVNDAGTNPSNQSQHRKRRQKSNGNSKQKKIALRPDKPLPFQLCWRAIGFALPIHEKSVGRVLRRSGLVLDQAQTRPLQWLARLVGSSVHGNLLNQWRRTHPNAAAPGMFRGKGNLMMSPSLSTEMSQSSRLYSASHFLPGATLTRRKNGNHSAVAPIGELVKSNPVEGGPLNMWVTIDWHWEPTTVSEDREPLKFDDDPGAFRSTWIAGFILLAAVIWMGSGFVFSSDDTSAETPGETAPQPVSVATRTSVSELVTLYFQAEGQALPDRETAIRAETSGEVSEVLVRKGADVVAGDILARLTTKRLEADLDRAREELDRAQREFDNAEELLQRGVSTVDRLASARATLAAAEAQVTNSEEALDAARIEAPFDGRIERLTLDEGEFIAAGTEVGRHRRQPPAHRVASKCRNSA